MIANVAIYLLQSFAPMELMGMFALWPWHVPAASNPQGGGFAPWQLVTYSFLHGNLTHLLFNMFALYMFGSDVERVFGRKRYTLYYFICVVSAAVTHLVFAVVTDSPPYPTVGASGGVFGLLLAFGWFFPRRMVMLIIPPIPMPAWVAVTLFGALELFFGITGTQAGVANFAHLGGMLGAFLLIQWRRGKPPFMKRRRR